MGTMGVNEVFVNVREDGTMYCSSCEQRVHLRQTVCPSCRAKLGELKRAESSPDIVYVEDFSKASETKHFQVLQGGLSPVYEDYSSYQQTRKQNKPKRKSKFHFPHVGIRVIPLLVLIAFLVYTAIQKGAGTAGLPSLLSPITGTHHTETPVDNTTGEKIGFNYKIYQIFFKAKEDEYTFQGIESFLQEFKIGYENLHYTESGYYTADLTDYKASTKAVCEQETEKLQKLFQQWCKTHNDNYGVSNTIVQYAYQSLH